MNPRITVLMPAYNAEKYIGEAIRSVLGQTYEDFELLIVNDGSHDRTLNVIYGFSDPRIRVLTQQNKGVSEALNTGLKAARGIYIARFDADDICMPQRLARQIRFLDGHPTYLVTGCDAEYIAEDGEHLFDFKCNGYSHQDIIKDLYNVCPFIHSGVMYRRSPVLEAGGYPVLAHNFEDHLLWVKLVKWGKFNNLPEPLIKVRINPASVTIDEKWRGRQFRQLKKRIIRKGSITREEGLLLLTIICRQKTDRIRSGAYHALCGKKFLANNYHPVKARWHVSRAISANPFRWDSYAIFLASFLPERWIRWLHGRN